MLVFDHSFPANRTATGKTRVLWHAPYLSSTKDYLIQTATIGASNSEHLHRFHCFLQGWLRNYRDPFATLTSLW
jgi:hypothetical protein